MEEDQYTLATLGHFGCLGHFWPLWLFGPLWAISGHLCELDQEQKSPFEAQYQELMVKWRAAMEEYQYTLANGNTVEPKKVGDVIEQQDVTVGEETMMEMAGFGGSKGDVGKIDEELV